VSTITSVGDVPRPSLWEKPSVRDADLKELHGTTFKLIGGRLRNVTTIYGEKSAVDLVVEIEGEKFTYSGFSAGIAAQLRSAQDRDFPTFATIESIAVPNGTTTTLAPRAEGDGDPPVKPERDDVSLPLAADDDIPFL
jgi:hypothetical protein